MPKPSNDEMQEQYDLAQEHDKELWRGMTYEDGVIAALGWVMGDTDEKPMDD